jgi:hypothetical protein
MANPTPNWGLTAEVYAKLGYLGTTSVNSFEILVGAQGEGVGVQGTPIDGIADIARDRENPKLLPLIHNDDTCQNREVQQPTAEGGGATWEWSGSNPRQSGMVWDDFG